MRQKRIDQRAIRRPRRGMHDHPGGLVDYDQVIVLEHHIKSDVLRQDMAVLGLWHRYFNQVALADLSLGVFDHGTIHPNRAVGQQTAQSGARKAGRLWRIARQGLIKARRRIGGDPERQLSG